MGAATSAASVCSSSLGPGVDLTLLAHSGQGLHFFLDPCFPWRGRVGCVCPLSSPPTSPVLQVTALFALLPQKAYLRLSRSVRSLCWPLSNFFPSAWLFPQGTWSRKHREAHHSRWMWT